MGDHGANVNFLSKAPGGGWRYRTYERGVEAETLACGSGAVAAAVLLASWHEEPGTGSVEIESRSGRTLRVTLKLASRGWLPSLAGEGRVVYTGRLAEI